MIEFTPVAIGYFAEKNAVPDPRFVHLLYKTNELKRNRRFTPAVSFFRLFEKARRRFLYFPPKAFGFLPFGFGKMRIVTPVKVVFHPRAMIFPRANSGGFAKNCENCLKTNS